MELETLVGHVLTITDKRNNTKHVYGTVTKVENNTIYTDYGYEIQY